MCFHPSGAQSLLLASHHHNLTAQPGADVSTSNRSGGVVYLHLQPVMLGEECSA